MPTTPEDSLWRSCGYVGCLLFALSSPTDRNSFVAAVVMVCCELCYVFSSSICFQYLSIYVLINSCYYSYQSCIFLQYLNISCLFIIAGGRRVLLWTIPPTRHVFAWLKLVALVSSFCLPMFFWLVNRLVSHSKLVSPWYQIITADLRFSRIFLCFWIF